MENFHRFNKLKHSTVNPKVFPIYNASAAACTMREIVNGIADALGKHPFPVLVLASPALLLSRHLSRIPHRRLAGLHQAVKKWLVEDVYDTHRFEEAYRFQIKISLKDGLKREVDWYLQAVRGNGGMVKRKGQPSSFY